MLKTNHQLGFTLIELLVVIAIIGLISSVVLASLNTARIKGRDARRISDIKQLQIALEFYYDKNGNYPQAINTWNDDCDGKTGTGSFSDALNPLITDEFIPVIPEDPLFPQNTHPSCYFYRTDYSGAYCSGISLSPDYMIIFRGESKTELNLNYLKWGDQDGDGNWDLSGDFNRWCIIP
jgi:prepilin-type N-terminal cleavage/methylation domain-containing protein